MRTLELITSGKETTVFVDKILFLRKRNSTETIIYFGKEHSTIAKISYEDLVSKIKKL
jgi:hypothetical protein